jgi:tRNA U34 5-carboxymethylaminomethyl modifying GTPase MnmE/TrmE
VGIESRLSRLEAGRKREEAQLGREALSHLSDENLDALEDALEAGQEDGSATFEDLYRVSSEQSRRALESYFECLEAITEGKEPNVPTEAGEEEIRETRNGYRIWKYYRK